jgi:integrase
VTLGELCKWYVDLPDVKKKRTYKKEFSSMKNLKRILGENTKIRDITPGKVEIYQSKRLSEDSPRHLGKKMRPSTVNREIACLKGMINRGVRHQKLNSNPIATSKRLSENNVREKVLSQEEFEKLVEACPQHLRPVVIVAYYLGMRKSEILFLTWDEVDLDKGFINLSEDLTKTKVGRHIPLHPTVRAMLSRLPRGLHTDRVFLRHGRPFDDIKRSYRRACTAADLRDFTFHDLRHCAINNLRLAGNDYFKIMAISGHKTMSVFKRYSLVTEEELSQVAWSDVPVTEGE